MKSLRPGQRVRSFAAGASPSGRCHAASRAPVRRMLTRDASAWVALDARLAAPLDAAHAFPEGDERATWVLCWPDDCEPARRGLR